MLRAMVVLAPTAGAAPAPSPAPVVARAIVGELTRVDLVRRSITLKTDGRDARELEAVVAKETRFTSRGRTARLEDLRPGDRLVVMAVEDGGARQARLVKVMGRSAVASPPPPSAAPATLPRPSPHS
jgi:hypothetical protein